MKVGILGLGKMGKNIAINFNNNKHDVVGYDVNPAVYQELNSIGIKTANTIEDLVQQLDKPRKLWIMVPAGQIVDDLLAKLAPLLDGGDIVLDAGNSYYKDSVSRYNKLAEKGINFLDVGTSGGIDGALNGANTMIGGDSEIFSSIEQLFIDLSLENGYLYTGPVGSGHFLKMVHNGIEYGMMQAIAEGFEILNKSEFEYDFKEVARVWNNGSVIRSWLMELTEQAFSKEPKLESIKGIMHSSGEGKWTVETALELQASTPVIALALMMRYRSLESDTFAGKVVAALRNEFGGHTTEMID